MTDMRQLLSDKEHIKLFDKMCSNYIKMIKKKEKNCMKTTKAPVVIKFD